jgi:hypothetical protein
MYKIPEKIELERPSKKSPIFLEICDKSIS